MNSFNILGNILLLVERFSLGSNINKKQKQLSWFSKSSGLCFDSAVGVQKQTDRQKGKRLPVIYMYLNVQIVRDKMRTPYSVVFSLFCKSGYVFTDH
jgi:hypothetical protein